MFVNKVLLGCGPDIGSFAVCSSFKTIAELSWDRGHVVCAAKSVHNLAGCRQCLLPPALDDWKRQSMSLP